MTIDLNTRHRPTSSENLANALVHVFLNSNHAHDEVDGRQSSQYAGAALVRAIADHLEETDLGMELEEALRRWEGSPVDPLNEYREELAKHGTS